MKYLLVMIMAMLFSSGLMAHQGHVHETGLMADFIHTVASNYLWLSVMGLIGVVIGYRVAIRSVDCHLYKDSGDKTI